MLYDKGFWRILHKNPRHRPTLLYTGWLLNWPFLVQYWNERRLTSQPEALSDERFYGTAFLVGSLAFYNCGTEPKKISPCITKYDTSPLMLTNCHQDQMKDGLFDPSSYGFLRPTLSNVILISVLFEHLILVRFPLVHPLLIPPTCRASVHRVKNTFTKWWEGSV